MRDRDSKEHLEKSKNEKNKRTNRIRSQARYGGFGP